MRRPASVLLFAALSLAVHLAWVFWLPAGRPPSPPAPHSIEISFEAVADAVDMDADADMEMKSARPTPPDFHDASSTSPVPDSAESVVAAVQSAAALMEARPRATDARPHSEPAAAAVDAAKADQGAPRAPQPSAAESRTPDQEATGSIVASASARRPDAAEPAPNLDLSARAAALSWDGAATETALRCESARNTATPVDCEAESSEPAGTAAQAALARDLRNVAKAVPHLRQRDPPQLKARSDGTYLYEGHVFGAVVQPDGQVVFSDKATQAELRFSLTPFKVIADVNDIVEKQVLGRELYSAEKHWFLEQTRELRDKLTAEHRRREQLQARRALELALEQILDDAALSRAQKHAAMLALWQDCGDDADAEAHRRAVEAFVRRRLPKGSALGFDAAEIEQFNADRAGLRQFSPYETTPG